jgi:hypothetical protein
MAAMVAVVVAAGLAMTACAPKDTSPVIACELNGKTLSTEFTFNSFRTALAAEHGSVDVVTNASLKSRSLHVYFKPLPDGRLLADRVVILGSMQTGMTPAVLFGLTNAVPGERAGEPAAGGDGTNSGVEGARDGAGR